MSKRKEPDVDTQPDIDIVAVPDDQLLDLVENPEERARILQALQNENGASETYWRKLVQDNPDLAMGWTGLGMTLVAAQRAEEALEAFRRAVYLDPLQPLPHEGMGSALLSLERWEESSIAFQRAGRLADATAVTARHLTQASVGLLKQGKAQEALALLYEAADIEHTASTLAKMGWAFATLGKDQLAHSAFSDAWRIDATYFDRHPAENEIWQECERRFRAGRSEGDEGDGHA